VRRAWHIVTGEYAPVCGGVADYTHGLACALAVAGDVVHVWAPGAALTEDPGVHVHPLPNGYGRAGLRALSIALGRSASTTRVLVQYVPHAFGLRGVNVPFCAAIAALRGVEVWVMFHEVALPWAPARRWRANIAASLTRLMANLLAARADRVLVSIPLWEPILHQVAPLWKGGTTWLPIPSNMPLHASDSAREAVRASLRLVPGAQVIGHFGGYGSLYASFLAQALRQLLEKDPGRVALLVGRGGEAFVRTMERALRDRMIATGEIEADRVAAHLTACDVMIQPYPDGISTRRTSAMAGLALGVPTVTNDGVTTEPLWRDERAVALAPSIDAVGDTAEALLASPALAATLGAKGRELHARRFALARTVETLRALAAADDAS
jgi:hypothetical protein